MADVVHQLTVGLKMYYVQYNRVTGCVKVPVLLTNHVYTYLIQFIINTRALQMIATNTVI